MLNVQNLSLSINSKPLLKNLTFDVNPGEIVALCGESGSGKTLTALSVMRLIRGANYTGKILWNGTDLLSLEATDLQQIRGKEISYIFQEPGLALNSTKTIGEQIGEVFTLHNKALMIQAALDKAGFAQADLKRYPHQLSGGQKQRVMIAMALALGPQLIVADEPTTALDRHLQKQIVELLRDMKTQAGVLLITHDISVVKNLADRLIIMKQGEIVEQGNTQDVLANPQHPYTKILIDADPPGAPIDLPMDAPVVLATHNVDKIIAKSFLWRKTETPILQNVSVQVKQGHTLGIIGESGSGKTTLAKIIVNIEKLTAGAITFHGQQIHSLPYKAFLPLRRKIQYIFQDPYTSLNPRMTVEEILGEGAQSTTGTLIKILEQVGLEASALKRFPNQFSGGQRQRIAIARALLLEPELLILDEPTSALDRSVQKNILLLLKDLQQNKHLTYIFISHDLKVVQSICHDVVVLKNGAVVETGPTDGVFKNPKHPYTQLLLEGGF